MKSISELVEPNALRRLATPSNLRLGEKMAAERDVELTVCERSKVTGKVGGGQRRTTTLEAARDGHRWRCTCTSSALFCKHCAALAIVTREKAQRSGRAANK